MLGVFSFLLFAYLVMLVLSLTAWKNSNLETKDNHEFISVVVPFRNEAKHLYNTIESILAQEFSGTSSYHYEVLLINDHSTDNSLEIANSLATIYQNITVLNLSSETGKKAAIQFAIENSKGDLIIQTDADCLVSKNWLQTMSSYFSNNCRLLLGPVSVISNNQSWNWLNQIEMIFLQVITASSIYYNNPTTANGANLMYRKKDYLAYLNSGIGSEFKSGDDQHLLDYLVSQDKSSIKYVKDSNAIVSTHFPHQWDEMVTQRSRWASKNKNNKGAPFILGIFFLCIQLAPICLISMSVLNNWLWDYTWEFICSKIIIEFILLFYANKFFQTKAVKFSPLFSIIYPLFMLFVVIKSQKKNEWKGRSI